MKNAMLAMIAGLLLLSVPQKAEAALITWPVNGNSYDYVLTSSIMTWDAARLDAIAKGGHLATLTSAAENNFVWSGLYSQYDVRRFRLGASQDPNGAEPAGGWSWVTGEAWSYTNWETGEPNNNPVYEGQEDTLAFAWSATNGSWNDVSYNVQAHDAKSQGYIIEYNAVPEPATVVLLGAGLVGLLGLRRKMTV